MKEHVNSEEYELLVSRCSRMREVEDENEILGSRQSNDHFHLQKTHSAIYPLTASYSERVPLLEPTTRMFGNLADLLSSSITTRSNPILLSRLILPHVGHRRRLNKRSVCTAILLLGSILIAIPTTLIVMVLWYGGLPPSYTKLRMNERGLPQHQWGSGTTRNDRDWTMKSNRTTALEVERYLRFPDHLWGHGLNNVLEEVLMHALLAHTSNRSYVFEDFTWSHLPLPYTLYDFSLRPTRIPMSAFLGGWLVGQRFDDAGDVLAGGKDSKPNSATATVLKAQTRANRTTDFQPQHRDLTEPEPSSSATTTTAKKSYKLERKGSSSSVSQNGYSDKINESSVLGTRGRPDPGHDHDYNAEHKDSAVKTERHRPEHSQSRSSISAEYFEHICPPSERVEIAFPDVDFAYAAFGVPDDTTDGVDILRWWVDRLRQEDVRQERCVVIRERERRVWDSSFFGSTRLTSIFPILQSSPVLREFKWSSLVTTAVERTVQIFFSSSLTPPSTIPKTDGIAQIKPAIPGLLAVHLRRGDYKRHCLRLSHWGAGYMGWNRLLEDGDGEVGFEDGLYSFMDAEDDHGLGPDRTQAEWEQERERRRDAYYLSHCLPTVEQVVTRLAEVREQYKLSVGGESNPLTEVYVLTNGWPSFVDELREALLLDGWRKVVASVDVERGWVVDNQDLGDKESGSRLEETRRTAFRMQAFEMAQEKSTLSSAATRLGLNKEERGVSAAIDMGIAERAEVFVGNGFSSLSANVVLLRLAKGLPKKSNRML